MDKSSDSWIETIVSFISLIIYLIPIIILFAVGSWGYNHFFRKYQWTGYFYYDTNDYDKYWRQSGLNSLDSCRGWVNSQVSRDYDGEYDYECGKGCRPSEVASVEVCKTTEH